MTAPTKLAQRVTEVAAQMETERAALAEPDRPSGCPRPRPSIPRRGDGRAVRTWLWKEVSHDGDHADD